MMLAAEPGGTCRIWDLLRGERLGPPYERMADDLDGDMEQFIELDKVERQTPGHIAKFLRVEYVCDLARVRRMASQHLAYEQARRQRALRKELGTEELPPPPPPAPKQPPKLEAPPGAIWTGTLQGEIAVGYVRTDPDDFCGDTVAMVKATAQVREIFPCADYYLDERPLTEVAGDQRWERSFLGLAVVLGPAQYTEIEQVTGTGDTTVYSPREPKDFATMFRIRNLRPLWLPRAWYDYEQALAYTCAYARGHRLARISAEAGPRTAQRLERLEGRGQR